MSNIDTLGDELPREIARVRDSVIPAYQEIGITGQFAIMMMRQSLDRASKAMISSDIVEMIAVYEELKGYST